MSFSKSFAVKKIILAFDFSFNSEYNSNVNASGRLNLDFNKQRAYTEDGSTVYYYPISKYYASYNSIVNQNYWDKDTHFFRGKKQDGSWVTPFNPVHSTHRNDAYCEGNGWQYTWLVPHDVKGLISLFGSKEAFAAKLDSLFVVRFRRCSFSGHFRLNWTICTWK